MLPSVKIQQKTAPQVTLRVTFRNETCDIVTNKTYDDFARGEKKDSQRIRFSIRRKTIVELVTSRFRELSQDDHLKICYALAGNLEEQNENSDSSEFKELEETLTFCTNYDHRENLDEESKQGSRDPGNGHPQH